jgi:hypothetical protein
MGILKLKLDRKAEKVKESDEERKEKLTCACTALLQHHWAREPSFTA